MRKDRTGTLFLGYLLLYIAFAVGVISYSSSQESEGARIGATCRDGSSSGATGSGACSHHGGVSQWRNSIEPGTDTSDGLTTALVMALVGAVFVIYAKTSERARDREIDQRNQGLKDYRDVPPQGITRTPNPVPKRSELDDWPIPLDESKSQLCTCGSTMFKTFDGNHQITLLCSRILECGKTRPGSNRVI